MKKSGFLIFSLLVGSQISSVSAVRQELDSSGQGQNLEKNLVNLLTDPPTCDGRVKDLEKQVIELEAKLAKCAEKGGPSEGNAPGVGSTRGSSGRGPPARGPPARGPPARGPLASMVQFASSKRCKHEKCCEKLNCKPGDVVATFEKELFLTAEKYNEWHERLEKQVKRSPNLKEESRDDALLKMNTPVAPLMNGTATADDDEVTCFVKTLWPLVDIGPPPNKTVTYKSANLSGECLVYYVETKKQKNERRAKENLKGLESHPFNPDIKTWLLGVFEAKFVVNNAVSTEVVPSNQTVATKEKSSKKNLLSAGESLVLGISLRALPTRLSEAAHWTTFYDTYFKELLDHGSTSLTYNQIEILTSALGVASKKTLEEEFKKKENADFLKKEETLDKEHSFLAALKTIARKGSLLEIADCILFEQDVPATLQQLGDQIIKMGGFYKQTEDTQTLAAKVISELASFATTFVATILNLRNSAKPEYDKMLDQFRKNNNQERSDF